MRWKKQGLIFAASGQATWFSTHAALPVAEHIGGDDYRVYFSGRDSQNRAQIGYFELDITAPQHIARVSQEPVLALGPLGTFDDNGVTSACVLTHQGRKYLYYTGWSLGVTVPFYFYVGLAINEGGDTPFRRVSASPILERNPVDPYLTASPCVLVEDGLWRMWYVSCTGWITEDGHPKHFYHIKYAESQDGIDWERNGRVCIDYASGSEYAIARPVVICEAGIYKMWYSFRGQAYRIGYAESPDGLAWTRKDDVAGLDVSASGWDSSMIAYACVFEHRGVKYMLYNGNGYGESGIGLAIAN